MFKIVLIGEAGVGKSCIFLRIKDNIYGENIQPTVGIDTCSKTVYVDEKKVSLCIWDTAGVERYKTVTRNYYRNTHAVFLVFSTDNPVTLYYLSQWMQDVIKFAPSALKFLIGNKTDLERIVPKENAVNFCEAFGCDAVFYVSAKSGEGILELMKKVGERLIAEFKTSLYMESQYSSSITVARVKKQEKQSCCT